jgi:hypothetical protein
VIPLPESTEPARYLAGRAVAEFCAALCYLGEGRYSLAVFQLNCADESSCWALAWFYGLDGNGSRAEVEQTIWLLLTRERLDRQIAEWSGIEPARVAELEERARQKVRKAVEREQRRKKAVRR